MPEKPAIGPTEDSRSVALVPLDDEVTTSDFAAVKKAAAAPGPEVEVEPPNLEGAADEVKKGAEGADSAAKPDEAEAEVSRATKPQKRRKRRRRGKRRRKPKSSPASEAPTPDESPAPFAGSPDRTEPAAAVEPPPPKEPPSRVVRPDAATPQGTLTIRSNSDAEVVSAGRGYGSPPSTIKVKSGKGKVKLRRPDGSSVTLSYTVSDKGLGLRISASPWMIVKRNNISRGKTPQSISASRRHELQFVRPGQAETFVVTVLWNPKS